MRTRYITRFDNCSNQMLYQTISNYTSVVLTSFVNEAVDFAFVSKMNKAQ